MMFKVMYRLPTMKHDQMEEQNRRKKKSLGLGLSIKMYYELIISFNIICFMLVYLNSWWVLVIFKQSMK